MKREDLICCWIGSGAGEGAQFSCRKQAEWILYSGPSFSEDEATHACSDHLGHLVTDAEEHRVFSILTVVDA